GSVGSKNDASLEWRMLDKTGRRNRSRRTFLKLVPAAVGASLSAPGAGSASAEPQVISSPDLECAERIAGIRFSDGERELMRQSVAANCDHADALRQIAIGYNVEPAFTFKPYRRASTTSDGANRADRHGKVAPLARATPLAPIRVDRPRSGERPADEAVAFMPVTALATLLENRV